VPSTGTSVLIRTIETFCDPNGRSATYGRIE
jgi:hypothetical protein